ncbi:MAG TPA: hypothetical protein V6C97_04250 [Oculatellaceae cyanobacterium]
MSKHVAWVAVVVVILETAAIGWLVYLAIDQSITVAHHEEHIRLLRGFAEKHGRLLFILLKGKSRTEIQTLLRSVADPDLIAKSDGANLTVEDLEFKFKHDELVDIRTSTDDSLSSTKQR